MIYLSYGDYTHVLGEAAVTITQEALRDGMGAVYGHQVTWTIDGMLTSQTNQAALLTALAALESAYSADGRDLNYAKYFVEGQTAISEIDDYTSHNTQRLSVDEVKQVLMQLVLIQEAVRA